MRTGLAITALLVLGLSLRAADLRPPEGLPRYDFNIAIDASGRKVEVVQQATWTNNTGQPIEQLVFNVHSHFTPPKTAKEIDQYTRLLEIFRIPAREAIFFKEAFELHKIDGLTKVGADWKRSELKHLWNKELATALIVVLPEPLAPGASATVELHYAMDLPEVQGRWGHWKGVTFLTNWHPVFAVHEKGKGWQPTPFIPWGQAWSNEAGVFNARVRLPKDQQIACSGSIAKIEEWPDTKEVIIGPVVARDFALLASARFREFSTVAKNGTGQPVKVKCMAFPENEFYAKVLIKHAAIAIENYAQWFGPLPYPEFTIAESYFGWNGNECGDLVLIDQRVFDMPHLAEKYVQYLISHEVCHQWFYNIVGTNGYKETFMDEAIVTHLSHRLLNGIEGRNNDLLNYPPELSFLPGIKRENYKFSTFFAVLKNGQLAPAVLDLEKYGSVIGMFAAVYDRGSKIVGMIEERLGPTAFLEFMRRVYSKYYFRIIRVEDFQRELEDYTGRKWDAFFKDWLYTANMSDWSVDGVTGVPAAGGYRASVILSQRSAINEPTTLGFSFDKGTSYSVRVPIQVPPKPGKDDKGAATVKYDKVQKSEWVDDTHFRVEVDLPGPPDQVMVDPDLVIPDKDPANNYWKVPINYRPRPIYTFLDETNFTNDYDKWNVIFGPWFYGAMYSDGWTTRASNLGLRAGVFRTEEFQGGVYAGFRPTFGDVAAGFDALLHHCPDAKWEIGAHGEVSIAQGIATADYKPDRGVVWVRDILEPTASLYLYPREYAEAYVAYQHNWMPLPRHLEQGGIGVDPLTTLGLHYRHDTRTPYWDPDTGYYLDANVAGGLPLFGESRFTGLAWGQVGYTLGLPDGHGWLSDVKLAVRAGVAVGAPSNARLFSLGGNEWFRGYDVFERQGSCTWVGSLEVRIPLMRDVDYDIADRMIRLRAVTLAPFYDIGDAYLDYHSIGPVAHAIGVGVRFQVDFFSFLERATIRVDIAKAIGNQIPLQVWFGVQQPF
ncbi:MAG TPA: M1 family aminopeptidase [Gemmataceae bacterium]|jgi:hypothetical protein|nr:M1 family aminopeptidase [Gemmataceae bacterium]